MASPFEQIDNALNRYYLSLGISDYQNNGIGKFLEFCYANEADEDDIDDELEDMENCMYLDFDETFPFGQHENKDHSFQQQFIFGLIKKCYENPNITFTNKDVKHNNHKTYEIDDSKLQSEEEMKYDQSNPKIKETCDTLAKYYKSIGKPYQRLFSTYCSDNGMDDKELLEELKQDVSECHIIEFDTDFPFHNELFNITQSEKQEFKFDLIRECYASPYKIFDPSLPQCLLSYSTLKYLYTITEREYKEICDLYKQQCPTLWNAGMNGDKGFTYAMAIGRKYKFDYLQYLVDDFYRARVRNINKSFQVKDWCINHPHFKALQKISVQPPWKREEEDTDKEVRKEYKLNRNVKKNNNNNINNNINNKPALTNAYGVAVGAVKSYDVRCIPKLQFTNLKTIDDSLEIIVRYIDAAIGFVRGRLDESKARNMPICPFQIDFCIAYGKPKVEESMVTKNNINSNSNDDDDDDDEMDEKATEEKSQDIFVDAIGDIGQKLEKNKLRYYLGDQTPQDRPDFEFMSKRGLSGIYKNFVDKHKLLRDRNANKTPEIYLHEKRLIVFVDRRHKTGKEQNESKDPIWIYEPPDNCKDIPKDCVNEWHISASKTCLLPNMKYGNGKLAECNTPQFKRKEQQEKEKEKDEEKKPKKKDEKKDYIKIRNANIGSSFHCKGALMALQFIVRESDTIKCYMYWNGQMTRFMPSDCKIILPKLINMKWNNGYKIQPGIDSINETFLKYKDKNREEPNDIDAIIQRMQNNMKDVYFENICLRNK